MNATNNLTEVVLGFSRTYFAERESSEIPKRLPSFAREEKWAASQKQVHRAALGDREGLAIWPALLSRGIPELASPLAD